jgi:ABC-2 type transport system permease protein
VGLGALYPNFNFENAAEIPTSFGGAVCMIFSVGLVGLAVALEAWPIYALVMHALYRGHATAPALWLIAPALLVVLALTIAASVIALRLGLNHLEKLRER